MSTLCVPTARGAVSVSLLPILILGAACTGEVDASGNGTPGSGMPKPGMTGMRPGAGGTGGNSPTTMTPPGAAQLAGRDLAAVSGLRRLTADEYDNTLRDLLFDTSKPPARK